MQFIINNFFQVNFIVFFHIANFQFVATEDFFAQEVIKNEGKDTFSELLINNSLASGSDKASFSNEKWAKSSSCSNKKFMSSSIS
jgi:hypothetical protein